MMNAADTEEDLAPDPWVGHVLGGRYRLVAAIGAGGMGVVYRAWDLAADRYVVVKMPKRELLGEPKFLQRFEHELSALRSLSHPAVVPVVDVGNEQGTPFAVMPYLAGGSLKQRRLFTQDGQAAPETPANLWRWLPAVAQALDFVHSSGYVHRDVKPDNILFDGPGTPFLSDFGVAKIVLQAEDETASRGLTGTGLALGTPAYMAPELISGTKPSPHVDQYALAVTVYELLAARKPFDGPTPAAVILAHVTGKAPALSSLLPALPAALSAAVARGMAREPADRFGRCVEFATAVLAAVPPPSAAEKLQLMCPQCSRLLNVKPDWAGKQGNCPRCKGAMAIGADLKSLWLPGDRLGTHPAGETVPMRVLGPTPSRPIPIPAPTAPRQVTQPNASTSLRKQSRIGLPVLNAAIAAIVIPALIGMLISLVRRELAHKPAVEISAIDRPRVVQPMPESDPAPVLEPQAAQEPSRRPETLIREDGDAVARQQPRGNTFDLAPDAQPQQPAVTPEENALATAAAPTSPIPPTPDPTPAQTAVVEATRSNESPALPADFSRPVARDRVEAPSDAEVNKVIDTFREAYEDQYAAAKESGNYSALIGRLETVLGDTVDAIPRYALLVEAEELSVHARDLGRAMTFLDERVRQYEVDSVALRLALMKDFTTQKKSSPSQELYDDSIVVASRAVDRDEYEVALAAGQFALTTAKALDRLEKAKAAKKRTGREVAASATVQSRVKEPTEILNAIRAHKKLFDAYTAAIALLATEPEAQDANAAVGRYLCFTKRYWSLGLPALAKGPDDPLRQIAGREISIQANGDVSGALDVAGAWWDFMESKPADLTAIELAAIKDHAARQYAAMLGTITDPTQLALAEKRATYVRSPGPESPSFFAALIDAEDQLARRRKSDSPIFVIVPEPKGLSEEIYPLLPTAEEIKVLGNHLNFDDSQIYQATRGFYRRLEEKFTADKWTDVDVQFIIAVQDTFNVRLGKEAYYREWECARIASLWLLGSPDEVEFVRRARTAPQSVLDDLNSHITMRGVKEWLLSRAAEFPTDQDKAAALDRILKAGFHFRGITEFRAALQQQQQ